MSEGAKNEKNEYYYGLGRRKEAVAKVKLYPGKGEFTVNDKDAKKDYFSKMLLTNIGQPFRLTGTEDKYKIVVAAVGGGKSGQADAIKLGIARALLKVNPEFRISLKKAGFLTRDPREKERKKYGLKRARKAPQFSKR